MKKITGKKGFPEGYEPVAKIVDFGETKNIAMITPLTKEVRIFPLPFRDRCPLPVYSLPPSAIGARYGIYPPGW
eukprot:9356531-Pyramimonas_sp.AAC.1